MLTVSNMDKVLRSVYLDVLTNSLNERTNAFYKKIQKTSANVYGKEIIAPCSFGINGGVACVDETSDLPESSVPTIVNFKAPMMNIYGNMELSDKLIRISDKGVGSAVDMLNYEVKSLLNSASYNLRRMLMQTGDGVLSTVVTGSSSNTVINVAETRNFIEGMVVDFVSGQNVLCSGRKIIYVDKTNKTIKVDASVTEEALVAGIKITVKGSFNKEIYGVPYIFSDAITTIYGNSKALVSYAVPAKYENTEVTSDALQEVLDNLEEESGSVPNMIISSFDMRRKYLNYLREKSLNIDYNNQVDDGFSSICYNGVPIYTDAFMEANTMYFINSDDFVMGQLADWSWIEGTNHDILHPIANKAAYGATLVKYCNLICTKPSAQARLKLVTE